MTTLYNRTDDNIDNDDNDDNAKNADGEYLCKGVYIGYSQVTGAKCKLHLESTKLQGGQGLQKNANSFYRKI